MPFLIARPAVPISRLEGDTLLIGRGTNAGLRLDDQTVSLAHARIERDPAGYTLTDLGSETGTYLNGKKVESATYLKDGDAVGIGGSRLRVHFRSAADLLGLEVQPVAAAEPAGPAAVQAPEVDYAAAYTLRRPLLTKGALAVFLTLAAVVVVIALPLAGALRAFQPGAISERHQHANAGGPIGCFDCHTPWKGPTATSCQQCHKRTDHQERQTFTPACSECHLEHRAKDRLALVSNARCVDCHGDMQVKGGGSPRFARNVTGFPEGHADFSVTLAGGGRLPVTEAVARRADPGTVRLDHARHLKPGLITPKGRETLKCEDCHQPGNGPTGLMRIDYKRDCNRCHRLNFDDARPDEEVRHGEPRDVYFDLLGIYQTNEGRMGSLQERRRVIIRTPGADLGLNVTASVKAQVEEAENHVYRSACIKCHAVDMNARPYPTVARARLQGEWLPYSHFDHRKHLETQIRGLTCETCHAGAAASRATADVLLPGIEMCGGCHGPGKPPGNAERRSARNDCRECHAYHPGKKEEKG